jgi:hypothetical protein
MLSSNTETVINIALSCKPPIAKNTVPIKMKVINIKPCFDVNRDGTRSVVLTLQAEDPIPSQPSNNQYDVQNILSQQIIDLTTNTPVDTPAPTDIHDQIVDLPAINTDSLTSILDDFDTSDKPDFLDLIPEDFNWGPDGTDDALSANAEHTQSPISTEADTTEEDNQIIAHLVAAMWLS